MFKKFSRNIMLQFVIFLSKHPQIASVNSKSFNRYTRTKTRAQRGVGSFKGFLHKIYNFSFYFIILRYMSKFSTYHDSFLGSKKRSCLSTGICKGQFIQINGTLLNISQVHRAKSIINLWNCSKRDTNPHPRPILGPRKELKST